MPVQAIRETSESRLRRHIEQQCALLSTRSVPTLDAKNPEGDFKRWANAIRTVITSYGPLFVTALDIAGDVPEADAITDEDYLMGAVPDIGVPQMVYVRLPGSSCLERPKSIRLR